MDEFIIPKDIPKHEALKALAGRYPNLDPSAIEACVALLRVGSEMFGAFKEHFARHGTSQGRFIILMLLNLDPERRVSPSELADMSRVTRATVTGLLDGLETDGLVQRIPLAEDRRSYSICLTPKGRSFMDAMLPDHFRRMAALMSGLTESERKSLVEILFKVRAGLAALQLP
jgi:DNA-binding MarR family transcriptional regulator